ncbi:hypothetical protein E5163_02085 [Marinicauda algicola]|uniref:Uncharacterized protein n=1 Tax=Marinicauda algicola TaxID=2029849 RepID=A0A4S2H2W1_9PROT|nr:hypothetical protein [Marinicauda algicola]TGY89950.1 hypothetical protein E5163_02085 [Marinicauda algicola]
MSEAGDILGEGRLAREALARANIHPETGLATDYLNHFNEVVMLMDMLSDMPECAEDMLAWEPCGYVEHFRRSSFAARDLAIAAYGAAPKAVRAHLETIVLQIDAEVARAQSLLRAGASRAVLAEIARLADEDIRPLISAASGAIHGRIDGAEPEEGASAQADIDALFG